MKKGFSLIEVVVYMSILAFMLLVIIEVIFSIIRSNQIISSVRSIENSAITSLERITREIREADSIVTASSTLGTHPGDLLLSSTDSEGNPRTVEFYVASGRMRLKENGVDVGALTQADSLVSNLVFRRFATSTVEGIKIEMTLESGTSTHYRTKNFYSSALIR